MNLREAVDSVLSQLRRQAESRHTLEFAVYVPDADSYHGITYTLRGYEEGKVQSQARQGDTQTRYASIGGVDRPILNGALHLGLDADRPAGGKRGVGWEYEVVKCGPLDDPALAGTRWLVWESPIKTQATARRLTVVEVT